MMWSADPMAEPWKPRTCAAAIAEARYGSSPGPSTMRPHRGSRAMSEHGRERPVNPDGPRLGGSHGLRALDERRIPRGGHADRHREDRPETVHHVEAEEQRNLESRFVHGHVLQAIRLLRIGDEEQ